MSIVGSDKTTFYIHENILFALLPSPVEMNCLNCQHTIRIETMQTYVGPDFVVSEETLVDIQFLIPCAKCGYISVVKASPGSKIEKTDVIKN